MNQNIRFIFSFWSLFLRDNFNRSMYNEFRRLALEDAEHGYDEKLIKLLLFFFYSSFRYGIESLFRFYSFGLEKKMRAPLYNDFQETILIDLKRSDFGLEKFCSFLKCKFKQIKLICIFQIIDIVLHWW